MGGNAFDTTATRLSVEEHNTLTTLLLNLLTLDFARCSVPRTVSVKNSHGDIDILCAYEGAIVGGDEECIAGLDGLGEVKPLRNAKPVVGREVEEMRQLGLTLGKKLGAICWRRNGNEFHFKLPLSVLQGKSDITDQFYQVDLILVAPKNFDFIFFTSSYAGTSVLLGRALKFYSRSLTLHLTHVSFRHSPFFGIQPVEIIFTEDPAEFCKWLGMDYRRWLEEGLKWRWEGGDALGYRLQATRQEEEARAERYSKEGKEGCLFRSILRLAYYQIKVGGSGK
nr:hypothetical protein L203_02282 [Cryptococcus depauperatus CBS 7841]